MSHKSITIARTDASGAAWRTPQKWNEHLAAWERWKTRLPPEAQKLYEALWNKTKDGPTSIDRDALEVLQEFPLLVDAGLVKIGPGTIRVIAAGEVRLPPAASSAIIRAEALLINELEGGPQESRHVQQVAKHAGISARTLQRARLGLGIRAIHKVAHYPDHQFWIWELPPRWRSILARLR